MREQLFRSAMASRNPALAEKAAREIDIQLLSLEDSAQRAGLFLRKAVVYGACSRFDDARKQIDLAVKENSTDPDFQLNVDFIRASLYDQEGFPDKALNHLTELSSAHAGKLALSEFRDLYEDIQQRRALDSVCVGKYNEAIPLLRECLSFKLSPEIRVSILCKLGDCYSQLNEYGDARDSFLAAKEIGLTQAWAMQVHCQLGIAYAHLDSLNESKRELQICEKMERNEFPMQTVYEWLSSVCGRLGETTEADRYLRLARTSGRLT